MRHIKKYDYSSQIKADLTTEKLGKPYVAGYADTIDWNSRDAISGFNEYFYVESYINSLEISGMGSYEGYYSLDSGSTWSAFTSATTVTLSDYNAKCYLKFNLNEYTDYVTKPFTVSGDYGIGGNFLSLINGDNFTTNGNITVAANNFFADDTNLKRAEKLILCVDTLYTNIFNTMFGRCSNLVTAPPILSINKVFGDGPFIPGAYLCGYMFSGCTALTTAPEIVVNSTNKGALFGNMFDGCSSLNNVTCLIKNNDFSGTFMKPFQNWLTGVSATGTFVKNKNADWWESGASGIPSGWTVVDSE